MLNKLNEKNISEIINHIKNNDLQDLKYEPLSSLISKVQSSNEKENIEIKQLKNKIIKKIKENLNKEVLYLNENLNEIKTPTDFLINLTKYFKENPKEIKNNIKIIKKIIESYENNFDNIYLLVKNLIPNLYQTKESKKFLLLENIKILYISDELSEILNEYDYTELADKIFLLKGKLELGINRYFNIQKYNLLLASFNQNSDYRILNYYQRIKSYNYYIINQELYQKDIKIIKNRIEKTNNIEEIIEYLKLLKRNNEKEFKIQIKKYLKIIETFGEKILTKKEFEEMKIIKESLNKESKINFTKIKEKYIIETNKISIRIKLLELLN